MNCHVLVSADVAGDATLNIMLTYSLPELSAAVVYVLAVVKPP